MLHPRRAKQKADSACRGRWIRRWAASAAALPLILVATSAAALQVDGFTEPFRTVDVAAAEAGVVEEVDVREGATVHRGQILAKLDSDIHRALLLIAEKSMQSRGRIDAALAELQLREQRLEALENLHSTGHARPEEVRRARTDVAVAEADLRTAEEDQLIKRLEYEKIKAQLDRRLVRSPVDGVVSRVSKEPGEFVAANDPNVLTIVQLDQLLASFSVAAPQGIQLEKGQELTVHFPNARTSTVGVVEVVAPVTDAESGTVLVKVRIENSERRFRSGERCTLDLRGDGKLSSAASSRERPRRVVVPSR